MRESSPAASANFTAVLLAGGKSSRMGRDKAAVLIAGEPLWQRQLATLRATAPAELLISGKLDGPYVASGVEIVTDENFGLGPLGGIAAALRRAAHPLVLVLAIDLPDIRSEFLCELIAPSVATGKGTVAGDDRWFEPLAAVYPRACLPLAEQCLRGEDRSMQKFVRAAVERGLLHLRLLRDHERPHFRNVNEPRDLQP